MTTASGRPVVPSWVALLAAVLVAAAQPAAAHRMDHAVGAAEAQVVTLSYPFGAPPMYEPYRIYAPGADAAFQTGRTDRLGRVSFVPDRPGDWRVVVNTEDGHGTELTVRVGDDLAVAETRGPGRGGVAMTLAGVGYLLGLAGVLVLWRNRSGIKSGTKR